ncbi:SusC/RagA family TonB-linked outer membrane protein [Cecembia lonarensis]|uniref:Outer membrane cobalamin receptor protein n=1 Tax=Cecembia lonarensis (strain CCUG 58316 / KCTC 22772 / LW9) TaxID=1225176 RepID=K1M224_CECL9|nr:TonB-dependent receptor [Cecembia lonarensis]EKB50314.1 Outer membrane cobalamin receptor protein [Cecembia lonarensis LW9]
MKRKFYQIAGCLLFLLILHQQSFGQSRVVQGKITDDTGEPIPGATVLLKGTTSGTAADLDGNYSITAPETGVLIFSFIGFMPMEVTVGNQSTINVTLKQDLSDLEEVIVVGYGTQKKSQLTGAISSVGAKEIQELPISNARQALQGRAAGVDVTIAGSKPGAGPQVRIRGRRSFTAGNDPLYVVDNIPIVGNIDDINPQDIVSMEILKDASATAIYGSRGANGVVLVTTRRGNVGKTVVSFDMFTGFNESLGRIEVFDGPQFAEYKRESRRATGNYPEGPATPEADATLFEPVELDGIARGRTTDYVGALLRTGVIQNYQVGVQGGSDKTTFFVSGNYFKETGVVKNQDFSRYTFRINLDHKITDKISIGTSTLLVNSLRNGENFNPIGGAMQENPLGIPFDENGNLIFLPTNDGLRTNPFAEIVPGAQLDEVHRYRMFNSIYGVYKITDNLTFRTNFGPDFSFQRAGRFTGSQTNARRGAPPTGSINERWDFNYTLENILTYDKKMGDHALNLTGLQAIQQDRSERTSISVLGIPAASQLYHRLGDASQITGANTDLIEWALLSYMGRINYSYKEKYLLTATMRADGSSRFGANTKFGYFPSVAFGWNITNEPFLVNSGIDLLKFRASYGSIGNQAIFPYQTQPLLGRTVYAFGTTPAFGYRPSTIGNPDLRWESSTTLNIGLDFGIFQGKLGGSLEFYQTETSNLLAPQPLPNSIGFGAFTTNIGVTRNTGFEVTLNSINIDKSRFRWSTDLIFNTNREQILSLANGRVDDIAAGRFIGQPITVFYDLKKVGIWQTNEADVAASFGDRPGEIKIEDFNGDGRINADDRQILGSPVPRFILGVTNRFTYDNFDFSFFVFARVGQMLRSQFHDANNSLFGRYNNLAIDYWTPNNPTNDFPRPNQNQERPKYASSMTYFDGSFVKIRNINFGYTFPNVVTKRMKMESLRIYSSIQQPFIFAEYRSRYKGIDPETFIDSEQGIEGGAVSANVAPAITTYTIGINARF